MDKYKRMLFLISLILITFTLTVCSKKDNEKESEDQSIFLEDSTVVAVVNSESIYYQDVDAAAKQMIIQTGLSKNVSYKDSVIQKQALDWIIANTLLRQETKKYTIEVKDQEVDGAIEQIKKNFPSEERFAEALQQENISMRKFRENIVVDLKVQKLLEQEVVSQIPEIKEEDIKKYYNENILMFQENEQARARHILIRVKEDASETEVKKARKKIESILAKLKQGQDFIELAKTSSEGPSAAKGGDLGFFSRGDMVKAFDDVVFSLKKGEISDIVRTNFGFHIIKLEDLKTSHQTPLEKVKDQIKEILKQLKSTEQFEKYVEQLKTESNIKFRDK